MLPKGEAYSGRFVRPVPCPANNFKTAVDILRNLVYR